MSSWRIALALVACVLAGVPVATGAACTTETFPGYQPFFGCQCQLSWTYNGQTFSDGQCANPDRDLLPRCPLTLRVSGDATGW